MSDGLEPVAESAVIAALDAWRARGAASTHPVALRIVEALARRAAAQQGEARQVMLRRVAQLIGAQGAGVAPPARAEPRPAALAGLSALVDRLGRAPVERPAPPRQADARMASSPSPRPPPLASLNAVTAFQGTWSRLRADQRLRQAVSQVPAMAGPLNSSHVVNRTLQTMRDLSPAYLEAFMAQVDTLMWLERASGGGEPAPRPAAAPKEARRAARTPSANGQRQAGE